MQRVLSVERTILAELELALHILAIFRGSIVFALAFAALKRDQFNCCLLGHKSPLSRKDKAPERDRTADLNLTMVALCRLSYRSNNTSHRCGKDA